MVSFNDKAWVLGITVAALFVGCGNSSDLGSDLISAECRRLFRCAWANGDTDVWRLMHGSEANCVATWGTFDIADEYQPFIDAGTVVIDEVAADRCLAARRATCSETVAERQACNAIFVGQVAAGGGCQWDLECASGRCTVDDLEQCGTCGRRVATGEACRPFEDACEDGPNGERGACSGGFCLLNSDGYPREDAGLGDPCNPYQLCEEGLYCRDGTCAAWGSRGDACDSIVDSCGRDTYCRASPDNHREGVCVRMRVDSRLGAACGELDDELVGCSFAAGLYCNSFDGVCASQEVDRPAEALCQVTWQCGEGLECVGGECFGEPLVDGSRCWTSAHCASGACRAREEEPYDYICQRPLICP